MFNHIITTHSSFRNEKVDYLNQERSIVIADNADWEYDRLKIVEIKFSHGKCITAVYGVENDNEWLGEGECTLEQMVQAGIDLGLFGIDENNDVYLDWDYDGKVTIEQVCTKAHEDAVLVH